MSLKANQLQKLKTTKNQKKKQGRDGREETNGKNEAGNK